MLRTARSTVAALVLLLSAVLVAVGSPVSADPPGGSERSGRHDPEPPGDEPLPGYTISNPPLAPLVVGGEESTVQQGVHEHAAYILEVPADWNGELVMWAHGYRGDTTVLTPETPAFGLRRTLLEQGYAWAASSYSTNGYDVASGVRSTKELADHSGELLPRTPARTYIAGVSMGGHVIGRSLEDYPSFYDGGLPMCGQLGDVELFDYLLDYNLIAQALSGRDAFPVPADYQQVEVPAILESLGLTGLTPGGPDTANARGDQLRRITIERSGGPRPGAVNAFANWEDYLLTLPTPDDGRGVAFNTLRVATNLGRVYRPNAPVDVNRLVERVAPADPFARFSPRLSASALIEGRPRVPVLSLHNLGDMFVPFSMEQIYAREVARHHRSPLLVQRAIRSAGHCEFSPAEVSTAWNDLVDWVESSGHRHRGQGRYGDRPAGDDVLSRRTVADPAYGCAFTDPAAYGTGTRELYDPC